jgi:site-specific DNA-methyltransferase (adenine-specific)/modification methylase
VIELNKIYNVDCLEFMDGLIAQGVKVDAIITDLPIYYFSLTIPNNYDIIS